MVHQKFRYANTLGQDHLSQRRRNTPSWDPTIIFSEKKSWFLNNLSLDRMYVFHGVQTLLATGSYLMHVIGKDTTGAGDLARVIS